jgi:hypothetical protein
MWGRDPASTVYAVAEMLVNAVLEQAQAIRSLLSAEAPPALAIDALARAALEPASVAWWLLNRNISARARVARLYVVRRCSAGWFEHAANAMQVSSSGRYGTQIAGLDLQYRDQLGLTEDLSNNGNWVGCEGQRLPSYTHRVANFLSGIGHDPTTGLYNVLSASVHGELWRLQYGYAEQVGADGVARFFRFTSREFIRVSLGVCVECLFFPLHAALSLLGRYAARTDLEHHVRPLGVALQ